MAEVADEQGPSQQCQEEEPARIDVQAQEEEDNMSEEKKVGDEKPPNQSTEEVQELNAELWGKLAPLNPDEDVELVTPDGGVLKKILEAGLGDKPPLFARCLVHYVGRIQSTGSIFLDTKTESASQQPVKVVAGRHTSPKETGLFMGVATMRVGEKAVIYVQDPKYGYGEAGSFSFPAVPPAACLTYDVECVDFELNEEDEEGDHGNLMYEDRLERAEQRRVLGNQLFAEGRYRAALGKYATALSYMDEDFMVQLEGFYEDKAHEVKIPIHLNMAACQLRIKDFNTAIYNCGEVLRLQPGNAKALFRRGVARHALGQSEGALEDLNQALEKAPEDKAIRAELASLKQTLKKEREAQAKLFKGQFKFPAVVERKESEIEAYTASRKEPEQKALSKQEEAARSQARLEAAEAARRQLAHRDEGRGRSQSGSSSLVLLLLGWLWAALAGIVQIIGRGLGIKGRTGGMRRGIDRGFQPLATVDEGDHEFEEGEEPPVRDSKEEEGGGGGAKQGQQEAHSSGEEGKGGSGDHAQGGEDLGQPNREEGNMEKEGEAGESHNADGVEVQEIL